MKLTDIFIHRPVLSMVVSLLIFVVGIASLNKLTLRQYPEIEASSVIVNTIYPGANQALVQGFVTAQIEQAVSSVEGIDYVTGSSIAGSSVVTANLNLGYNANTAMNEINAAIQSIRYQLPSAIQDPVVSKGGQRGTGLVYISYSSPVLTPEQITDYLARAIVPKLQTVKGVAQAQILGGRSYAMRIWLDPLKMNAFHVSAAEVVAALQNNNVLAAPGNLKGRYDLINVMTTSDLSTAEEFNRLVIRNDQGMLIRIQDIGHAKLGAQSTNFTVKANGQDAVVIEVDSLPDANSLTVANNVLALLPELKIDLPPAIHQILLYNAARFIQESIDSVMRTLIEATLIVLIVIFLFLGTLRAVSIPVVTIPLSLVGVCFFMLFLGYSMNILTLLAMILAIGLVVDDSIVVVENINRHLEKGETPLNAALLGAREISMPVISMSTTLAAVFIPIGFLGGLTGKLFTEFAFTLAGAVILSGVIALTLSPMMCSRIMSQKQLDNRFVLKVDRLLARMTRGYRYLLLGALNARYVTLLFGAVVLVACFILYATSAQELAPPEDQGYVMAVSLGPTNANSDYTLKYMNQISKVLETVPEKVTSMAITGMQGENSGFSFLILEPRNDRARTAAQISEALQSPLNKVTGLQTFVIGPPTLPGTDNGAAIQLVLTTLGSYNSLDQAAQNIIQAATASHLFYYTQSDLKINQPQITLEINRNLMSDLGIRASDVANALSTALSEANINWFNLQGRSYQVIPEVYRLDRWNPSLMNQLYLKTASGDMLPLSSIVTLHHSVEPNGLNQFQQLNSVTISAQPAPSVVMGTAMQQLEMWAKKYKLSGMSYSFTGQSRQYSQEAGIGLTLTFALIFIFLVLSAQFESFREPIIILLSVPTAICGALIFLNIGLGSVNIFTKIGLVTLIGLIAKQGILIVEFANELQAQEKLSVLDAVVQAACIRLRPILMTTAAMVFGAMPLLFASEGLVNSQRQLAMVIVTGMTIGTLLTIFLVPVLYTFLAGDKRKKETPLG